MYATMTSEIVEMARGEAVRFERKQSVLERSRPLLQCALRLPLKFIIRFVARRIDAIAHRFAHHAMMFAGARQFVIAKTAERELDADERLRELLDGMERDLLGLRRNTLDLISSCSKRAERSPENEIVASLRRAAGAAAELYEEVRAFKGAIQAHDANVWAVSGGGRRPIQSEQELQAQLARICD